MSAVPVAASPRTPETPMAFRSYEFARGALAAWVIFMVLLLGAFIVFSIVVVVIEAVRGGASAAGASIPFGFIMITYAGFYGAIMGGLATLVGALPAWFLGWTLRRVRARSIHVIAFAVLGALVGTAAIRLFFLLSDYAHGIIQNPLFIIPLVASVIAVPAGWWFTVRRALRTDARSGVSTGSTTERS